MYVDDFKDYLFEEEKSENTIKSYANDIEQFLNIINKDEYEIVKKDIIIFKKALRNEKISTHTINRKLTAVNRYIKFLNDKKDLKIIVEIKKEKIQRSKFLKEILSKTDYRRMIGVAERKNDKRAVAIFKCLYLTGMRVSEALQLDPVDASKTKLYVQGKGKKDRMVIIPAELNKALKEYLEVRVNTGDKLFTGKCGNLNRQGVHYIIKIYAGKAKVKLSRAMRMHLGIYMES
ncbi:MAG: integrase/recombinase XerD [Clostridium sp.]